MAADHCILCFANHRGNYMKGMARLSESLNGRFDGTVMGFVGEASIGAPDHLSNPYAFKIYAFQEALRRGFKKILYLDCSVFAVRPVDPIFKIIERDGYVMQESGHYLRNWINDNALNYFGISRDALGDTVMYGNAGLLGLDFNTEIAQTFFEKWKASMLAGCFKGSWDNHRHDMAAGSMIAWLMHMDKKYIKGDEILEYAHWDAPIKNETIIFKAAGL